MTGEAEFRAKWEARIVEAMAATMKDLVTAYLPYLDRFGNEPDWDALARAALAAYQRAMWMPMSEAPAEGKALVASYAPTNWAYWPQTVSLMGIEKIDAGRLKYGRACQPLPLPPKGGE